MTMHYRTRNRISLRPINRIKHVVDLQGASAIATQFIVPLIDTVDAPVITNVTECQTGSTVNGIYLHVEAYATTSAALSNLYLIIFKNPGNNLTMPDGNVVGSSDNKKYVFHQEMVMLQKEPTADSLGGNPRTVFNGVIAIPKGYRRNGPDDQTALAIFTVGITSEFCIQCHYKEFR